MPSPDLLKTVTAAIDTLIEASQPHQGLFPAMMDRATATLLRGPMPPQMEGLRDSDRAYLGCNLTHDVPLLETMVDLSAAGLRPDYAAAADRYLHRFATHCAPASVTGLFPWGEHSFWDLVADTVGNSYLNTPYYKGQEHLAACPTHHQIGSLPRRQWERLGNAHPEAVTRFAEGLEWHWSGPEHRDFNRHAPITEKTYNYHHLRHARHNNLPAPGIGSDFPGSAGHFVHSLAVAQSLKPTPVQARLLRDYLDYWWDRRLPNGLTPVSSARPNWGLGQTLSHLTSLIAAAPEAARFDADLADEIRHRARAYLDAVLAIPQPLTDGQFIHQLETDGTPFRAAPLWNGPDRGRGANSPHFARRLLRAHRALEAPRALDIARRMGRILGESPVPEDGDVRAADLSHAIGLLVELHEADPQTAWLDTASAIADRAVQLFFDLPLPRAGVSRDHYESQAGSSHLIRSLQQLALAREG